MNDSKYGQQPNLKFRSLKWVWCLEIIIENTFSYISSILANDFITSHSRIYHIFLNIKEKISYLDHKIIFEDFMLYPIYDGLEIFWL